ncbi:hypothetical protein N7505_007696 [Penicillium chrysogenum]|uniref:Uncharacterized protein n=1 Tax=Penicillium chrysogenum TaxID=5076 RepID=A0ABQ8WE51_PENCH|nr:hypothetical protein N7505_007696 [Penicillium chrysogenum]
MMRLMQKNGKNQGVVGVNDLERWPIDSAAVEFLSATETAESIESLDKLATTVGGQAQPKR